MATQPKLERLLAQLNQTGLQKDNPALFQVISQLIKFLIQQQAATGEEIVASTGSSVAPILGSDLLTHSDESSIFPNSRNVLAGSGISFDDTVANQRTINNISQGADWDVLSDGDLIEPEIIFADGEVIMLHIP